MITVAHIEPGSDAERAGLMPGDRILRINDAEIRDRLDFEFHKSTEVLDLAIEREGKPTAVLVERTAGALLGIEPEVMKINLCKNNCVFCFVYQTPKGMRKSLYVKDEDYRYSFLDGHFTTLSNMKPADWQRVLEQRLSPLYISVHATDPEVRARLLKNDKIEPVLERLHWLKQHDLQFHTQLVVVPGWNDGEVLEKSLRELRPLWPNLVSISVVPIGLTAHREKLTALRTMTLDEARDTLERTARHGREAFAETGENFIFASDEIYVQTGEPLPETEFYGDFSQYENGVGTLRALIDDFGRELPRLPKAPADWQVTVLTGKLASATQRDLLATLKKRKGLQSELIICDNKTFGSSVTVTGLLCGADFAAALETSEGQGPVLIPPNSLNKSGSFLDDMTPADLEARFKRPVFAPNSFRDYFPR